MILKEYVKSVDGQEEKFVSEEWYQNELNIINWKFRNGCLKNFELYNINSNCRLGVLDKPEPIKIGVSWYSGKGDSRESEWFAEDLLKVSKIAKEFKYSGYYIDHEIDKDWSDEDQKELKKYVESFGIKFD